MNNTNTPKLAPPGAGLPPAERAIAALMLGFHCLTGNRDSFNRRFRSERTIIAERIVPLDEELLARRVLIPRPRGLEDSSRHWSVLMTVDHLRIANAAFVGVIKTLASGREPGGQVSTAAVKPDPTVGAEVIGEYESGCDALLAALSEVGDLKTKARYRHPWFWKMDAHGWHALAASHMAIHREQISRIIAGL
jgi:hypothetical protein